MNKALSFFIDSLDMNFLHIRKYGLEYTWSISGKVLPHTVLWLLETGEIALKLDEQPLLAQAGDLLVMPGGAVLSSHAITSSVRLVSLNLDARITFVPHRSWTELLGIPKQLINVGTEQIGRLIQQMLQLSTNPVVGQRLLLQAHLLTLTACILAQDVPALAAHDNSTVMDCRILAIIDYLHANPRLMPEVSELADLVQLSESHLRKLFVRSTGLSPNQFIRFIKLDTACRKLTETNERISDIAYSLGFQDANYFSRLFKDHTGCTAAEYRRVNQAFLP